MPLDLVLNDLSYRFPAADRWEARRGMARLVETMNAASRSGFSRTLRFDPDMWRSQIAPGYTVVDWIRDATVDQVSRDTFRVRATASPFLTGLEGTDASDRALATEFFFKKHPAKGLGVAYLLDTLAVSLLTDGAWDASELELEIATLDDDGEIDRDVGSVKHAATDAHVREHQAWADERLRPQVADGAALMDRRSEVFTRVEFCSGAVSSIQQLRRGTSHFQQVLRRLLELEEFCRRWTVGPLDPDKFPSKMTPESDSTIKHYGTQRTFLCPDGQYRLFSWHVRVTPGKWRIHFVPQEDSKTVLIGYVGPKLPTSSTAT